MIGLAPIVSFLLLFYTLVNRNSDKGGGLFETSHPLTIIIETDLSALLNDIGDERKWHSAKIIVSHEDVDPVDIKLKTRGHFRREKEICDFPPIEMKFQQQDSIFWLFSNQSKLKLVTNCRTNQDRYQQYILQEYLVYRIYNILTNFSFRVRLANITYKDAEKKHGNVNSWGFMIENIQQVASRNSSKPIKIFIDSPDNPDYHLSTIHSMFQYMIGNTDWFLPDHNLKLITTLNHLDTVAVPFDFDLSGLVNAHYNMFYKNLNLSSPSDRYFQGFCRNHQELQKTTEIFNLHKEAILRLYRDFEYLNEKQRTGSITYLEEFYKIINNPGLIEEQMMNTCSSDF